MNDATTHLTEEERHTLAEVSATSDDPRAAHLRDCGRCADDVARIRALMSRARELPRGAPLPDDLWPSIRSRIESKKVLPLDAGRSPAEVSMRRAVRASTGAWATLAVLTAAAVMLGLIDNRGQHRPPGDAAIAGRSPDVFAIPVADSTAAYEEEAKQLLDRLELQRALLRPEAARALDDDLRTIDAAIAELQNAIVRDPKNPALRQLLASSYRQKVELLRRAENAG